MLCGRALMGGGCVKVDARATLRVFPSGYLICARRCVGSLDNLTGNRSEHGHISLVTSPWCHMCTAIRAWYMQIGCAQHAACLYSRRECCPRVTHRDGSAVGQRTNSALSSAL